MKARASVSLSSERATFGEPGTSSSRLAQHRLAVTAHHNCLRVTEHGGSAKMIFLSLYFHSNLNHIQRIYIKSSQSQRENIKKSSITYMLKHPWHLTSWHIKNNLYPKNQQLYENANVEKPS